ncbi:Dihydropteroate synthase (DHPS) (Dihydropteroate pyrophosphorylase), partial [Durusdinium trenchii]
ASEVPLDEELKRVVPVIQGIREAGLEATISIDTRKASVARKALEAGADWINDVSGGEFDPQMLTVASEFLAPIVLMHMKGTPETMNSLATYSEAVVTEVGDYLLTRRRAAEAAGVPSWNIILDPGIGFAKTLEHNLSLLRHCGELVAKTQPSPLLVGASRKRFIGTILQDVSRNENEPDFKKRSFGNAAATAIAIAGGADLVRVHEAWLCYVLLKVMFIYFPRPMGRSTSGKYVFLS